MIRRFIEWCDKIMHTKLRDLFPSNTVDWHIVRIVIIVGLLAAIAMIHIIPAIVTYWFH